MSNSCASDNKIFGIKCNVENCVHNTKPDCCDAGCIHVGPCSATTCNDTTCSTFEKK